MAELGVKDCSKHLAQGGKRYSNFILEAFKLYLEKYDKNNSHTDLVFFEVSSNVQKAGKILSASYPQITLLHDD